MSTTAPRSISGQLGGTKGARIGPFVLDELVGSGPYAEVWHARHAFLEGPRATLKLFTHPMVRQLLSRGPAVTWLEGNRYVPATIDFRPDHDPPYVATAHTVGKSLRQELSNGALDPRRAVGIIAQLIAALKHAHQHGVLHLDLKSENILLGEGDQLILLDLSVGRFSAETSRLLREASSQTLTSSISRGLRYRSREQMKGTDVDARADVYGFGLLLFEMLTGDLPQGAQLPSQVNANVPRRFDQVFSRCCSVLEKRFETMQAVEQELRAKPAGGGPTGFDGSGVMRALGSSGTPTPAPTTPLPPTAADPSTAAPTPPAGPVGAAAAAPSPPAAAAPASGSVPTAGTPHSPYSALRGKLRDQLPSTVFVGERTAVLDMCEMCGAPAFDIQNIPRVTDLFERLRAAGLDRFAIGFGRIDYIASNGFGFLVNFCDQLRGAGGMAALFGVQAQVATLLDVMGMTMLFTLCPDRESALAAVRPA